MGFLLKENPGYSRSLPLDEPNLAIAEDLNVQGLAGSITLTRTPQGLYVQGQLSGRMAMECDLCLTPVEQRVTSRFAEMYYYPPDETPDDGLPIPEDMNVDFAPVVREDMLLSVPLRVKCRPDCKGLCPTCGKNWNEGPCDCQTEEGDSRFSVLKKLLDDSSKN